MGNFAVYERFTGVEAQGYSNSVIDLTELLVLISRWRSKIGDGCNC